MVQRLVNWFRSGRFQYSTAAQPVVPTGDHPRGCVPDPDKGRQLPNIYRRVRHDGAIAWDSGPCGGRIHFRSAGAEWRDSRDWSGCSYLARGLSAARVRGGSQWSRRRHRVSLPLSLRASAALGRCRRAHPPRCRRRRPPQRPVQQVRRLRPHPRRLLRPCRSFRQRGSRSRVTPTGLPSSGFSSPASFWEELFSPWSLWSVGEGFRGHVRPRQAVLEAWWESDRSLARLGLGCPRSRTPLDHAHRLREAMFGLPDTGWKFAESDRLGLEQLVSDVESLALLEREARYGDRPTGEAAAIAARAAAGRVRRSLRYHHLGRAVRGLKLAPRTPGQGHSGTDRGAYASSGHGANHP